MPKNKVTRKNRSKSNKSGSASQESHSSSSDDSLEYSPTFQTTRDFTPNSSRYQSDFQNISSSAGSTSTPMSAGDSLRGRSHGKLESSTPKKPIAPDTTDSRISEDAGGNFCIKVIIGLAILALLTFYFGRSTTNDSEKSKFLIQKLEALVDNTRHQFPLKDDSVWDDLTAGIVDVIDLNRQAVFLLIYSNGTKIVHKLAESIAEIASQVIKSDSTRPLKITYHELNRDPYLGDHGKLISKYRTELEVHGALIVQDLHLVKGTVAQAFHTICDQYSPLVEKSVIVFTMNVNDLGGKPVEIGENRLKQVWADELEPDILSPLVTRLTVNVLKIV